MPSNLSISATRLLLSLLSHFLPQALYPCSSTTHKEHRLWKQSPILLPRTSTALMQPRFAHHSLRLGGTETLRHCTLTHTEQPRCQMLMHLLNLVSQIKTSLFLLWIWVPAFIFQIATDEILVLPFVQEGLRQSMFCPQVMIQPAADMNTVPTSAIIQSILKWL